MKKDLQTATPDDVKILLTSATELSAREVLELYATRWQIELFFKELKSTLGFAQYRFKQFTAVHAWVEIAITTVLFLEYLRQCRADDRSLSPDTQQWWGRQRLYGLCAAFRQETISSELKYMADRLKTPYGVTKLKRILTNVIPPEYRLTA